MREYQFIAAWPVGSQPSTVQIIGTQLFVPLNSSNSDCVRFLSDWKAGAEVKNPDGTLAPYSDEAVIGLGLKPV